MNILLINHYAGSLQHGMEYRPYYLAREWVRAGHKVRILAASYSHARSIQPHSNGAPLTQPISEWIDGIEYIWYPTPSYKRNGIGRVFNIFSFLRQIWLRAQKITEEFQPDVVIASSTYPMDIWPAHRIAKRAGAKLVFEIHDLWPLSLIELGGMSRWHPFVMLVQSAENYVYRHVDRVISILPKVAGYTKAKGLDPHKLHVVPNGVAPEDWVTPSPLRADVFEFISAQKLSGKFVVGYAGSHGIANALDTLLDAAKILSHQEVVFLLIGDGQEKERLLKRVKQEHIKNIYMFSPLPKNQIPTLLSCFDAAYLGASKSPLYQFGVSPNKLLDYMMASVPVVYAVEAGNNPIEEAECGISIMPENESALASAFMKLARMPLEEHQGMGKRGRSYAEKKHIYPILAKEFLAAL